MSLGNIGGSNVGCVAGLSYVELDLRLAMGVGERTERQIKRRWQLMCSRISVAGPLPGLFARPFPHLKRLEGQKGVTISSNTRRCPWARTSSCVGLVFDSLDG